MSVWARATVALAVALLAATVLAAPTAEAANRRVAIADYSWSEPAIEIDRGEHVTWHWTGPDTMHSVTGTSANAAGVDSDPGSPQPRHRVGDSFRLDFEAPGTYTFQCKLHSLVRGTVVVSSRPGDPSTEVDPIPSNNVDFRAPRVTEVRLGKRRFHQGTRLRFGINERATVEASFYSRPRGKSRPPLYERFAGWQRWRAHVGYNDVPFARRAPHFKRRPGRYVALIRATDAESNEGRPERIRFRIRR